MRTFVIKKKWSDASVCEYNVVYERYKALGIIPTLIYKICFFDIITLQTWIVKIKEHYGTDKVNIIVEPGALVFNNDIEKSEMVNALALEVRVKPNGGGKIDG